MTIEIDRPDVEALHQPSRHRCGISDPQEVIFQALPTIEVPRRTGADLIAAIQASPYRDVELEVPRDVLPIRQADLQ